MRRSLLPVLFAALTACSSSNAASDGAGNDATTPIDSAIDDATSADVTGEGAIDALGALDARSDGDEVNFDDDLPFAKQRKSCAFKAGDKPSATFGPSIAKLDIPLDVIVIAMQENRSFDHYFSQLPAAGQPDVDVAKPDQKLPDGTGTAARFHQTDYCFADADHSWSGSHNDVNGGKNDQFVDGNNPGGTRAIGWFDQSDLPFYYALATTYGVGDRHFCSVLGPTFPNRLYLYEGTSSGHISNVTQTAGPKTIFEALTAAKVSWKIYSYSTTQPLEGVYGTSLATKYPGQVAAIGTFPADAAAGKLAQVIFMDAGSSEHPPGDMQLGEVAVQKAYNALATSPQWAHAAFILTYDENGGLYDHVPPAKACVPDAIKPIGGAGAFDSTGFRVPLVIASPYSKPHYVSHQVTDATSILRFLELKFDLPALTARDANASTLIDYFDFGKTPFATPPKLATATVDAAKKCP